MFLFDWKKVYKEAEGNIFLCITIMEMLITKRVPDNKYDPIYKFFDKDYAGKSFLLHPDILLLYSYKHSIRDIAIYYSLASIRSLPEYLVTRKITLDLLHVPVDLDLITDNRLLRIDDEFVHFIYEEVPPEKIH